MICTPRANIHLCVCKQVQTCVFLCTRRNPLSITTLRAIHRRCSMQPYRVFFFLTWIHTLTCTHTQSPKSGGSNEARGDTAELSVNPQLADTRPTTSMTPFLKQWRKPVGLHQMWRELWGPSDLDWERWRWDGVERERGGGERANLCVLHFGKVSGLCVQTPHLIVMHLKHVSKSSLWFMCRNKEKKKRKVVTTSLVLPGLLAKPGLQSCSSNQQWGHVFQSREREREWVSEEKKRKKRSEPGGLDVHSVCHACI